MPKALDVFSGPRLSGHLEESDGRFVFAYDSRAATKADVSLTMPIRLEAWVHGELHPIFQMNLPEGAMREALTLALAKLFGSDDLTVLNVLGRQQVGRLGFSLPGHEPALDTGVKEDLEALLDDAGQAAFKGLLDRHLLQSGISGVQPKVLIEVKDKAAAKTPHFIAKAWGPDFPHLAANEHLCLLAARRAGLPTAASHLSKNRELLLIERFDRGEHGEYLGFEDFAVLQAKAPRRKYDSSLERCAKTIVQFVAPERQSAALADFFKLTCLNWLIRNGDAHLKNFGVLYASSAGPCSLAPAFDLVCTTAYLPKDVPALSLEGSKRWWPKKSLHQFGRDACRLNSRAVDSAMHAAAEAVQQTLADLKTEVKENPGFADVGKNMQAQWLAALAEF